MSLIKYPFQHLILVVLPALIVPIEHPKNAPKKQNGIINIIFIILAQPPNFLPSIPIIHFQNLLTILEAYVLEQYFLTRMNLVVFFIQFLGVLALTGVF